ncbi:MAG: hypothetical protein J0L84_19000 [Verrucomicrobia bacterium]|nr:hypothetical protein [Verrucomicrobiota bacterium]
MNAQQAFIAFVQRCILPDKARRFSELAFTKNGQQKVLASLDHDFEHAVRSDASRSTDYDGVLASPCFVFYRPLGFGAAFDSVREAYDQLAVKDGWLILLRDGSAGVHRPESR